VSGNATASSTQVLILLEMNSHMARRATRHRVL
jgi:hypothetical protein